MSVTANEVTDTLSTRIHDALLDLSPILEDGRISKVPECLREVNKDAYEPHIVAIGPYHRQKAHLQKMEEHKKWYLKKLLERSGETENDLPKYVKRMKQWEKRARACYADSSIDRMNEDDFAEMMLYDSCFIIELFRRYANVVPVDIGDSLISFGWINKKLARDLLLVENQLPFFVIAKLFLMTRGEDEFKCPEDILIRIIFRFFACFVLPESSLKALTTPDLTRENKHLVGLIYDNWFYSTPNKYGESSMEKNRWNVKKWANKKYSQFLSYCPDKCFRSCKPSQMTNSWTSTKKNLSDWVWDFEMSANSKYISGATELIEAGIKFKKAEADRLFDVKFRNGVLEIPQLEIKAESGSFFHNLVVYEQFFSGQDEKCVSNYMKFMDCLIDTSEDVELLCKRNILHNCLGDYNVVADMFNKLGDSVPLSPDSHYAQVFRLVNQYSSKRRNKWKANFNYGLGCWT